MTPLERQLKTLAQRDIPEGFVALLASWEGRVKGCPVVEVLAQEVKSEGQIRDPNSLPAWGPFPCPSHWGHLPFCSALGCSYSADRRC